MPASYPTREELGRAIRRLRQNRDLTLEKLADMAGMHTTYLSRIERAHSSPTFEKLTALAKALDMPVSAIVAAAEAESGRR